MEDAPLPDYKVLVELAHAIMFCGKYKGRHLSELPVSTLNGSQEKDFPKEN